MSAYIIAYPEALPPFSLRYMKRDASGHETWVSDQNEATKMTKNHAMLAVRIMREKGFGAVEMEEVP